MAEISRVQLFGKLNRVAYKSIESATVFCKMRGNPYVELVHWIHQILQLDDSDLKRIVRHFDLNVSRLAGDLTAALDRLPRGATSISDFSSHVESSVREGWMFATLMFGRSSVRTGHLLVGIGKSRSLASLLYDMSAEFRGVAVDDLTDNFSAILSGSPEEELTASDASSLAGGVAPGEASSAMAPAAMGKQQALKQFTVDLTERARNGEIDPIVGRDQETRQIVDILMRRRQNNPILTGEAGVGKTAVVEGFAQRIAVGDVPPPLKNVRLLSLDLGLLQAGASMKGEFENRLKQVIEEVQSSAQPIILFIDEAHTLIGAGGAAGQGDAANLLKPALARGTLRTVAATTWAEYKKYFEKDPALTRRFQNILIDEPSDDKALLMMRGMASKLEEHHKVQVLDEALEAAVTLSRRYIPARQLPDKSVSVLDTACARVAISHYGEPASVEDSRRRIEALETESEILDREESIGIDHSQRRPEVASALEAERKRREELQGRWRSEKELVDAILAFRAKLRDGQSKIEGTDSELERKADEQQAEQDPAPQTEAETLSAEERAAALAELTKLQAQLAEMQGETPLILPAVDEQAVASVIADWTGIPVGRMVKDEISAVLSLADRLEERVVGQRHAMEAIAKRIQTARASLSDPSKPIGVMMLAGPSGVGKTETALALAEALYGGEHNLVTINMSEFQEAHTVSTLKGAPPGYVGYGEGGVLTEAVRRKPYSVVLLDEIEKAHPDVHEIFFQVFDKGHMEDGEGRLIDFRNTVILLTTNVGTDLVMNMCKDPELMPTPEGLGEALREPLLKKFPAALLGRMIVIPYCPLGPEVMDRIIRLKIEKIQRRVQERYRIPLTYDEEVLALIGRRGKAIESGARMIDAIITNTLLPRISEEFLTRTAEARELTGAHVFVENDEFAYDFSNRTSTADVGQERPQT